MSVFLRTFYSDDRVILLGRNYLNALKGSDNYQ